MRSVSGGDGLVVVGFLKWLHQSKPASNLLQSGDLLIRFKLGSDHLIDACLCRGSATELLPARLHAFDIMHCDLVEMSFGNKNNRKRY